MTFLVDRILSLYLKLGIFYSCKHSWILMTVPFLISTQQHITVARTRFNIVFFSSKLIDMFMLLQNDDRPEGLSAKGKPPAFNRNK